MEIPKMDLYILRDSNVGIDVWFDAGSSAVGWNPVSYILYIDIGLHLSVGLTIAPKIVPQSA